MSSENTYFDVCVLCALAEEAEAFMRVLSQQEGVSFTEGYSQDRFAYQATTIQNKRGEPLKILLSWLPRYGPMATVQHLQPLLKEFQPRFVAMTGICAGYKHKVKLGDLVVAERTFIMDNGKVVLDEESGQPMYQRDTLTSEPPENVLQFARTFGEWKTPAAILPRPISKRQQREWLLNKLLDVTSLEPIPATELEMYAPAWSEIVDKLQEGPNATLTKAGALRNKSAVQKMRSASKKFPFEDPKSPTLHIAPMASGSAVRSDNPFEALRLPVRDTLAVDMEGAAFYQVLKSFPGMSSLLVKGICDYADSDKDDTYHTYASELSALYMLSFIKKYVNQELMPARIPFEGKAPISGKNQFFTETPSLERKPVDTSKAFNVYFSYDFSDQKDKKDREELEKHLIMLKRKGLITCWHSGLVTGGQDVVAESTRHLYASQIIFLLISPSFLVSDHYDREVNLACELYKVKQARVIPILLRPVDDWESTPFGNLTLGELMALPRDNVYIYGHPHPDALLLKVAQDIRAVVTDLQKKMV